MSDAIESPREVLAQVREHDIRSVVLRCIDSTGGFRQISLPADAIDETTFELGVDLPEAWCAAPHSSMRSGPCVLVPDPQTLAIEPFAEDRTMVMLGRVRLRGTTQAHLSCPRSLIERARAHLRGSGIADDLSVSQRVEFFVFDDVRYRVGEHLASHRVDSNHGHWNRDREEYPNLGDKPQPDCGALASQPVDGYAELREAIVRGMAELGSRVRSHWLVSASGGHCAIELEERGFCEQADVVSTLRYLVRNLARRAGKVATFMPRPLAGQTGASSPSSLELHRGGVCVWSASKLDDLGATGSQFFAGLLAHAPALSVLTRPSTNGHRGPLERTPGVNVSGVGGRPIRFEYTSFDANCCPHVAFAAMLMAGLDGVRRRLSIDDCLAQAERGTNPTSLADAATALANDREFLLGGQVFSSQFIDDVLERARAEDLAVRTVPHPREFELYFTR